MDYKKNCRYFEDTLSRGFNSVLFAILIMLAWGGLIYFEAEGGGFGLGFGDFIICLCFPMMIFGFILPIVWCIGTATIHKLRSPTDAYIDAVVKAKVNDLKKTFTKDRLLLQWGLDDDEVNEVSPITGARNDLTDEEFVFGPCSYMYTAGKDGFLRSNRVKYFHLFFTSQAIYYFTCTFSLTSDYQEEESTVLSYDDVIRVSFGTETRQIRYCIIDKDGNRLPQSFDVPCDNTLTLTMVDGSKIRFYCKDDDATKRSVVGLSTLINMNRRRPTSVKSARP